MQRGCNATSLHRLGKLCDLDRIGCYLACKETRQLLSNLVEAPKTSNFLCLRLFLFLRVFK